MFWLCLGVATYLAFCNWEIRGQFGDSFGVANSLFSGLAFAGLIYTVHLQRQELALQRKELELTRSELQRSAAAQEASERALSKQAAALETAARLNGLSSVIEHYGIKIASLASATQREAAHRSQLEYVLRLEELLSEIRDAEPIL